MIEIEKGGFTKNLHQGNTLVVVVIIVIVVVVVVVR